jgi:DNA topoisomerase-1
MRSSAELRRATDVADPTPSASDAEKAGLEYVNDGEPGIRRQRRGTGFTYLDSNGKAVRSPYAMARIRSLAIPPAWTDVWICASEHGHLQATARCQGAQAAQGITSNYCGATARNTGW